MRNFKIPVIEEVKEHDRRIFYSLKETMGFVPHVYAFMTHSDTALRSFLAFNHTSVVFTDIEKEAIQLVTSQADRCQYCISAHTLLAKKAGLTDEQIIDIRKGNVKSDEKLGILVDFTCAMVNGRGMVEPELLEKFYQVGYTDAHLVDLIMLIGRTTITNYLNNITRMPVDFPEAPVIICDCDCKHE